MTAIRCGRPRKGEEAFRRDLLLDRAMSLFAEHGYGALSLETIARQAHVSLRTIYRQFGSKAQLFGAVIQRISDEFVARLPQDASRPIAEVLEEFGYQFLSRITRPETLRLRAQILAEAQRFPELAAEFYRRGPECTLTHLSRLLAEYQRAGVVAELDSRFLAGQFLAALCGEWLRKLELGLVAPPGPSTLQEQVKQAVNLFLRGCLACA
ncbi:MAG: TetR/AcrR family transcriptional regulator [Methylohalobius sp.]|nr:TetR/AcrR family transcriptional regulator [Methylohalobius sp.]